MLTDVTTGEGFSTSTKMNNAKRSSAEWIAEAPSGGGVAPLANFVVVDFGSGNTGVNSTCSASTTTGSGAIGSFPAASVFEITMVDKNGSLEATPSALSQQGSSFSVSWVSSGS